MLGPFDSLLALLWAWNIFGLALFVWRSPLAPRTKRILAEAAVGAGACAFVLALALFVTMRLTK